MEIENIKEKVKNRKIRDKLDELSQEIDKIINLANSLVSFSKLPTPQLRSSNLNVVIEKVINTFKIKFKNVKFIFKPGNIPNVHLDERLTEVCLENVIKNAIESMDREKIVFITTMVEEIPVPEKGKTKKFVTAVIQDTGKGICKKILSKVGEPYFTTKEKGSGLGIYITKQLLKEQKAEFEIESEEGKGTRVIIRFPL